MGGCFGSLDIQPCLRILAQMKELLCENYVLKPTHPPTYKHKVAMQTEDEMYRLCALRYLKGAEKKKKVATHLIYKEDDEQKLPLTEAIAIKRDVTKMESSYNPRKVEKYWSDFWQAGYSQAYA
jgi:hypothetical protein